MFPKIKIFLILFLEVTISHTLRKNVFDALRGSSLEKIVKRLGAAAFGENRSTDYLSGIQVKFFF